LHQLNLASPCHDSSDPKFPIPNNSPSLDRHCYIFSKSPNCFMMLVLPAHSFRTSLPR
jgi:hypothetical protein